MLYCGIMWVKLCSFSSLNHPCGEVGLILHDSLKKQIMHISGVDVYEHKIHSSEACRYLLCVPKLPPFRLAQSLPCRHANSL